MRTLLIGLSLVALFAAAPLVCYSQSTSATSGTPAVSAQPAAPATIVASATAAKAKPEAASSSAAPAKKANPLVLITTSEGPIKIELWPDKAPATVANFLAYTKEGFYDGTIFHRVISGFMIQGGGFTPDMEQKATHAPVKNEARGDVTNGRGTIAMARTGVVDSATAQFFINVVDNGMLNHRDETPRGFGYCVFGQVVEGMDVVDRIRQVATGTVHGFRDVPVTAVVIKSVKVVEAK
jgi:cyclophilin family peptidyl-prolyl cis-trans isomerase